MRWLDGIIDLMDMALSKLREIFLNEDREAWCGSWDHKESDMTELQILSFTFRYVDAITLTAESEEELKSLLMKVKKENDKAGLELNTEKTKIMACGPIQFSSVQFSCSVVSDSLQPHEPQHARPPCP